MEYKLPTCLILFTTEEPVLFGVTLELFCLSAHLLFAPPVFSVDTVDKKHDYCNERGTEQTNPEARHTDSQVRAKVLVSFNPETGEGGNQEINQRRQSEPGKG